MTNISDLAKSLSALNNAHKEGADADIVNLLEDNAKQALRLSISELGGPATLG